MQFCEIIIFFYEIGSEDMYSYIFILIKILSNFINKLKIVKNNIYWENIIWNSYEREFEFI